MMKKLKWFFVLFIILSIEISNAQPISNKGKEFMVGFMRHIRGNSASMYLYLTSDTSTSGTVTIPGQNWSVPFTIVKDSMTLVEIPNALAYMGCTDCKEGKVIYIQSQLDIVVYAHIYNQFFSDATLVLPVAALGQNYYVASAIPLVPGGFNPSPERSQFMIMASQDNTLVRITPRCALRNNANGTINANTPYTILLNKGEAYQVRAFNRTDDITGSKIEVIDTGSNASCKKIAVFSGNGYSFVECGSGTSSGDNLIHQMYPINTWGSEYIAVPLKSRNVYQIRVIASEDDTRVRFNYGNNSEQVIIDEGQVVTRTFDSFDIVHISVAGGNKKIMVTQLSESQRCGTVTRAQGDPSLVVLSPVNQTLRKITLYSSDREIILRNYLNIIIPTLGASTFRLDGNPVDFKIIPQRSNYSYAQVAVNYGVHNLEASVGFLAMAYGFGDLESYAYTAGANLTDQSLKVNFASTKTTTTNTLCIGESALFLGTAEYDVLSWIWDMGDGTTKYGSQVNHKYKDTGYYTIKLKVLRDAANGCSPNDSTMFDIVVFDKPRTDFDFLHNCSNDSVLFIANTDVGMGTYASKYNWVLNNNKTDSGQQVKHFYGKDTLVNVTLFSITNAECRDTITKPVYIHSPPNALFVTDSLLCFNDSSYFVNLSLEDSGTLTGFYWDFGDGKLDSIDNPVSFYETHGEFLPRLIAENSFGCKDTFVYDKIVKFGDFTVKFVAKDTCLSVGTLFIDSSYSTDVEFVSRLWNMGDGSVNSKAEFIHKYDTNGNYKVKLIRSINDLCADSIEIDVEVHAQPKASFLQFGFCEYDSVTLVSQSSIVNGSISQIEWDVEEVGLLNGDEITVKFNSYGSKQIKVKSLSNQGCLDSSIQNIFVYRKPNADFNANAFCANDSSLISDLSDFYEDTYLSRKWILQNDSVNNLSQWHLKHSSPGIELLTLQIESAYGCKDTFSKTVEVYHVPNANFFAEPVCLGDTVFAVNNSTIVNGSINLHSWLDSESQQLKLLENADFVFNSHGFKTISLSVLSDKGCKHDTSKLVEIYELPQASFSQNSQCIGQTVNFINLSMIPVGKSAVYNWIGDNNLISTVSNPTHTYPAPSSYWVKLYVELDNGCKDSVENFIDIYPNPVIQVNALPNEGCMPHETTLNASILPQSGTIQSVLWESGDGGTYSGSNYKYTYNIPGVYNPKVIVTSQYGCIDSLVSTNLITVFDLPVAVASASSYEANIFEGEITFFNNSLNYTRQFWDFDNGQTSEDPNPVITFTDTGLFKVILEIEDENYCTDTTSISILIFANFDVFLPNAFSPNGDGLNDLYHVGGELRYINGFNMRVFNRWGELLYETNDPRIGWDGTYSGKPCPEGLYLISVYFRDPYDSKHYSMKTSVTLMR